MMITPNSSSNIIRPSPDSQRFCLDYQNPVSNQSDSCVVKWGVLENNCTSLRQQQIHLLFTLIECNARKELNNRTMIKIAALLGLQPNTKKVLSYLNGSLLVLNRMIHGMPPDSLFSVYSPPLLNLSSSNDRAIVPYDSKKITIVIDAFRAFTTASYVLARHPASYMLTTKSAVISRLAANLLDPLLIGKSEKGARVVYHIPNSPTRVNETKVRGRHVLHRTEAGAKGILIAKDSDVILGAGFVNAAATAEYVRNLKNAHITILPMGHEGSTPSLEDHICATYIEALIKGKQMALTSYIPALRKGPGRYFFSEDQWQYPCEDFFRCLKPNGFRFYYSSSSVRRLCGSYAFVKNALQRYPRLMS